MSASAKGTKYNLILKHEREVRGWSQRKLADEIGTNADTISKWERGINLPDSYFREKLCSLFQKNAIELGFVEQHNQTANFGTSKASLPVKSVPVDLQIEHEQETQIQNMDKSRRTFIAYSLGVTGAAVNFNPRELLSSEPWERLSRVLTRPASIDSATLSNLEMINRNYWNIESNVSSQDILAGIHGHLQTITRLLQYPFSESVKERLCSIAGEVAQILGQIAFDMNDYVSAQSYYKVSIDAAKEANDSSLYATALGRMSFLPVYKGEANKALVLLQKANQLASQRGTASTQAWLLAVEAEAEANLNNMKDSFKTLDRAEELLNGTLSKGDPYGTGFDNASLAGFRGTCYIRTHQPELAVRTLKEGLSSDLASSRRYATVLADLAMAYAIQGEVEEACHTAAQALSIAVQIKSKMVLQRIQDVRKHLEQWGTTPAVQDLDEQLLLI